MIKESIYNKAYKNDGEESGIETSSQYTPIQAKLSHLSHNDKIYSSNSQSQIPSSILNTSSISFDLMNLNAACVKTRYDVKSQASGSLYGSKVTIIYYFLNFNAIKRFQLRLAKIVFPTFSYMWFVIEYDK
jgi:hypothetical protein